MIDLLGLLEDSHLIGYRDMALLGEASPFQQFKQFQDIVFDDGLLDDADDGESPYGGGASQEDFDNLEALTFITIDDETGVAPNSKQGAMTEGADGKMYADIGDQ